MKSCIANVGVTHEKMPLIPGIESPKKTDLKLFGHLNINDRSSYKSSYHDG